MKPYTRHNHDMDSDMPSVWEMLVDELLSVGTDFSVAPYALTKGQKRYYARLATERGLPVRKGKYDSLGVATYARLRLAYGSCYASLRTPERLSGAEVSVLFDGEHICHDGSMAGYIGGVLVELRPYGDGWRCVVDADGVSEVERLLCIDGLATHAVHTDEGLYVEFYKERRRDIWR